MSNSPFSNKSDRLNLGALSRTAESIFQQCPALPDVEAIEFAFARLLKARIVQPSPLTVA